jgi:hypothetical protein
MAKTSTSADHNGDRRGVRRSGSGPADWANASPDIIVSALSAASSVGGALRFGYSRDGGAYAIGIYGDGEPYTEFVRPSEDIDGFLRDVEATFLDIAAEQKTGSKRPK